MLTGETLRTRVPNGHRKDYASNLETKKEIETLKGKVQPYSAQGIGEKGIFRMSDGKGKRFRRLFVPISVGVKYSHNQCLLPNFRIGILFRMRLEPTALPQGAMEE